MEAGAAKQNLLCAQNPLLYRTQAMNPASFQLKPAAHSKENDKTNGL